MTAFGARIEGAAKSGWTGIHYAVAICLWGMVAIALLGEPVSCAYGQDDVVGVVRTIEGQAVILRGSEQVTAEAGAPVRRHDVLRTSGDATLAVVLRDNTAISIGPNTRFTIEGYEFQPAQSRFSLLGVLLTGTFLYSSGEIGRLAPNNVSLRTPVGIIGIRGTRFSASFSN